MPDQPVDAERQGKEDKEFERVEDHRSPTEQFEIRLHGVAYVVPLLSHVLLHLQLTIFVLRREPLHSRSNQLFVREVGVGCQALDGNLFEAVRRLYL